MIWFFCIYQMHSLHTHDARPGHTAHNLFRVTALFIRCSEHLYHLNKFVLVVLCSVGDLMTCLVPKIAQMLKQ